MALSELDRGRTTPPASNLDALFRPASVVVVGASNERTKIGGRLLSHLLRYGYTGRLYVVHPSDPAVQGVAAYRSVDELPADSALDLAIVAVPAVRVPETIRSLAHRGVRVAVIVSSGFGETGDAGRALEDEVRDCARRSGMRVLGPNCQGVANTSVGLAASFSSVFGRTEEVPDGTTAVISQSGAMAAVLTELSSGHVDGVRYWAATGNELDLTVADLVAEVATDPGVRVVQVYLENMRAADRLVQAARTAHERGAAVLVLKAGASEEGARAASSHTGALAQEDKVVDAFLSRHGLVRARDARQMSELARLFAGRKKPRGNRVGIVTNSGGLGVLLADEAAVNGLAMAEFGPDTRTRLTETLPPFAATANPIDVTAQLLSRPELLGAAIRAVEAEPGVDVVVVALGILGDYYDLDRILADVVELDRRTEKLVVVCWVAGDAAMPGRLAGAGIPTYDDTAATMRALGAFVAHARHVERERRADPQTSVPTARLTGPLPRAAGGPLSEAAGKRLLRSWGLPVVDGRLAVSADEAAAAARELGFPVVLKVSAAGLAHKTELGLVDVGIGDEAELRAAAARMLAATEANVHGDGQVDGLLVEPCLDGGLEMSVGLLRDPSVGNVVVVGAGGTAAEVLADVQLLIPPLTTELVREAIHRLRVAPLLHGFRGAPARDVDSLVRLVLDLATTPAVLAGQVASLDLNPVLVMPSGQGSVAVDVALTPGHPTSDIKEGR
ncbi:MULTISPECIES: acetate--CoA ligase family protein [Amycolatopsis]|uniref:Acyl-CoA synthetase (NDP forming) n=2 Tax=Amycolatopsis TaxID=1813 RepID=A0A1I3KDF9_9PSEU|nr:acetate--CoA ligase family protein [Amycolatopsis sacchari]SFI70235.1 Acyl-CoA synthetase (NDP forming) [Amycolatopsis sacchari]